MKFLLSSCILFSVASAVPFQIIVENRATECFYEKLEKNDYATFSILIINGDELMGSMILEGPFAKSEVESTADLLKEEHNFVKRGARWTQHTMHRLELDFEHLQIDKFADIEVDYEEMMEEAYWGDDDDNLDDDSVMEELDEREREVKKLLNRKKELELTLKLHQIRQEKVKALEERAKHLSKKVREEGEPIEKTLHAKAGGWYRACLSASYNKITAELEFRTSKELAGVDPETDHVYTYEKYEELKEQRLLDEDAAEDEPSINVEDFEKTRNQMREMRRVLNQVSTLQTSAKHRMNQHGKISEHSNSRMTQDSIFVTALFIGITLFQVYTIQKWFAKTSILGR